MEPIRRITKYDHLKILADSRRLYILQRLMAGPATLSMLGKELGEHPARVRHHLKKLEEIGLVELVNTQVVRGFIEKYYRAKARAFLLNDLILPAETPPDHQTLFIMGSHDLALEALIQHTQEKAHQTSYLSIPTGSLEGLVALRQGTAHFSGAHLWDAERNEYNLSYVHYFFPDQDMVLLTLAHREQGLMVRPGNPRQIKNLVDLVRPDIILINRNRGSGTRLWLDHQFHQLGIAGAQLQILQGDARTHTASAEAVGSGLADVGLGVHAAAQKAGLDFIPLFQERFDLVMPAALLNSPAMQPLLNDLQSAEIRQIIRDLEGYDSTETGKQITPQPG
ncbi:MAG TPA: substrate-binding domain-containing protein [Anaerolineales bacterium]|nr:substrate-binding domain-containing protein [Anaerolineales bacterium]